MSIQAGVLEYRHQSEPSHTKPVLIGQKSPFTVPTDVYGDAARCCEV